ncbi:MAG: hypothetical protein K2O65_00315 [Lachnospiraceae bacterium]|nr:hypothetical protein [Lachnospiraceae bacterium]
MENKVKGKNKMFETIVDVLGIVVTIVGIGVTCIGIIQTVKENKRHQKSNRPDQS